MKSIIQQTDIKLIDPNPHRDIRRYPFMQSKLESLRLSIEGLGELWEGIIARPHPEKKGRFQIAFGHHRKQAAEDAGLKEIPLIVRDLADEEMLQFMGRENGEDYRSEFLIMLETWEAGSRHVAGKNATYCHC